MEAWKSEARESLPWKLQGNKCIFWVTSGENVVPHLLIFGGYISAIVLCIAHSEGHFTCLYIQHGTCLGKRTMVERCCCPHHHTTSHTTGYPGHFPLSFWYILHHHCSSVQMLACPVWIAKCFCDSNEWDLWWLRVYIAWPEWHLHFPTVSFLKQRLGAALMSYPEDGFPVFIFG